MEGIPSKQFYEKIKVFWEKVPATVDGVLEGHAYVHEADIQASSDFIMEFILDGEKPLGTERALDCGSGIGRVTKHLLLKFFKSVDMVEQNKNFLDASHAYLGEDSKFISVRYNCALQRFKPRKKYDLIWAQWSMGYLLDLEFRIFLIYLKKNIRNNGLIIVKDNITHKSVTVMHKDGSIIRSRDNLVRLFSEAGLTLIAERKQPDFPENLHEVKMFAFR